MSIPQLFSTKPIKLLMHHANEDNSMKRALSATNLTTLGIGAVIGAGIFVLTGQAAAQYAGPGIVISFLISGMACLFAGLCYAEFASMIPISGSAYTYAYATLGEFIAWIIGWDLILEYLFAASTVSVGWSGYVVSFLKDFGIFIPPQFTAAWHTVLVDIPNLGWKPLTQQLATSLASSGIVVDQLPHITAILNLPAMFIIAAVTILLVIGIKESAGFNNIMVIIKVGFDAVSTAAQEAKNPQRDMPIGILGSLGISTILYVLVAIVLTGIVSYTFLNVSDPIAVGVDAMGKGLLWLRPIIKIAAIAGLSSVILVMMLGQPRIFYAMAKDGLLPPRFAKIHPRFKTPYFSTVITGSFAFVLAGILPIDILGELVSIGTLLAFVIVCIGIIFLRVTKPELKRPFRTPLVPLIPVLGALICMIQMYSLPVDTWLRLIVWMAIGMVIYFTYSIRHSLLRNRNSQ